MGSSYSTAVIEKETEPPPEVQEVVENEVSEDINCDDVQVRRQRRDEEINKLREDLAQKRELRRKKLSEVSVELNSLREELTREKSMRESAESRAAELQEIASRLRGDRCPESEDGHAAIGTQSVEEFTDDKLHSDEDCIDRDNSDANAGKRTDEELNALREELNDSLEKNERYENQVKALKDVANIGKELLKIREYQVNELNEKLKVIEETGVQYEREVATMKKLKTLYEERAIAAETEHKVQLEREKARLDVANAKLHLAEKDNKELRDAKSELQLRLETQDSKMDKLIQELSDIKIELATKKEDHYHASSQLSLVNNLLSQIISGPEVDLDRLARFLEENHDLINEITNKGDINSVASTLAHLAGGLEDSSDQGDKQEIATNLCKVWRILVELLSHHKQIKASSQAAEVDSCYKSVETPSGPKLVISVSQTFIRLKDLILEKNSLVKEVSRLRKLNQHLETRMVEQEGRLTNVTSELHNTWDVVNKLKIHHEHLHEHEMILRYELQQKRLLLNDLKKQLEKSRTQWAAAREKNSQTERDWKKLRAEFARRKKLDCGSTESGYEDEQSPDDTDEDKSCEDESISANNAIACETAISPVEDSIVCDVETPCPSVPEVNIDEITPLPSIQVTNTNEESPNIPSPEPLDDPLIQGEDDEDDIIVLDIPNPLFIEPSNCPQESIHRITLPPIQEDNEEFSSLNVDQEVEKSFLEVQTSHLEENASAVSNVGEFSECLHGIEKDVDSVCVESISGDDPAGEIVEAAILKNAEERQEDIWKILEKREERISRLEGQCSNVVKSIEANTGKGEALVQKLDSLHEQYGRESPTVPSTFHSADCSRLQQEPSTSTSDECCRLAAQENSNTRLSEVEEENREAAVEPQKSLSTEEILRRREERLKRMEESCKWLFTKMDATSVRSDEIANKLDQIHAQYGETSSSDQRKNDDTSTEELTQNASDNSQDSCAQ